MPEPTTTTAAAGVTGIVTLAVAMLGPVAGPYAVIVFAALSGALWPLSTAQTSSLAAGAWLLVRCTLTAVILTAVIAGMAERWLGIPAGQGLAPVAMLIGALGNGWRAVFVGVGAALAALVAQKSGADK